MGGAGRLERLGRQHRLWLITNGDAELQRRKVRLAGLDTVMERIFVSAEVGWAKPADRFYDHVEAEARRAGLRIALVIGDSVPKEIVPARARGWPVALIGGSPDAGVPTYARLADVRLPRNH
ncbi:HAD family hydrolase [Amycolatopsis albispora]|uniref:Haloacid dehalogenase n=1 Tax=Amycolatopsis albispora TaxID=1804986 RepID=A0A344L3G7_9PSEU|nr:HAD hydrolase-like protein [Amycolatopsis albispora]AXB42591.1 hypothetical protein A4R43_08655 [Amycolatopsis albispora]